MTSYVLSPAARADLKSIWDYTTEHWGAGQAEAYLRDIERGVERVVQNPLMGRRCDEVRQGYRRHSVGSHTLYYRIVDGDDVVDVVRVLHKGMDVDQHLD